MTRSLVSSLSVSPKDHVTKLMVGKLIREARQQAGLKQEALAAQLGIDSNSFISQVERGRLIPSLDMAHKLELALQLPAHSVASLVLKYRIKEVPDGILEDARERGLHVQVRLSFKD